jgi:toxin-antitoxin system PIN domain toxin
MRGLLDVNFIIALLDPDHAFHERSHTWWAANSKSGWASCPLTENGVVRIMSNPNYSEKVKFSPSSLIDRLQKFAAQTDHEFWPDDISLWNEEIFVAERIHGSRQLTDIYLLALAAKHLGRLVTFDQGIPLSAVIGAKSDNLCIS